MNTNRKYISTNKKIVAGIIALFILNSLIACTSQSTIEVNSKNSKTFSEDAETSKSNAKPSH